MLHRWNASSALLLLMDFFYEVGQNGQRRPWKAFGPTPALDAQARVIAAKVWRYWPTLAERSKHVSLLPRSLAAEVARHLRAIDRPAATKAMQRVAAIEVRFDHGPAKWHFFERNRHAQE